MINSLVSPVMQASFAVGRTTLTAVTPVAVNVGKFAGPVLLEGGKTFIRTVVWNVAAISGVAVAGVVAVQGIKVAEKAGKATRRGYAKTIRRLNARLDETPVKTAKEKPFNAAQAAADIVGADRAEAAAAVVA